MRSLAGLSASICFLCLMGLSTVSFAQTSYSITDLGTINTSGYSVAKGVNLTGEVTGAAGSTSTDSSEVFLYSKGTMTNLGTLEETQASGTGLTLLDKLPDIPSIRRILIAHSLPAAKS